MGIVADRAFRILMAFGLIAWIAWMVNVQADYEQSRAAADTPGGGVDLVSDDAVTGWDDEQLSDDWGEETAEAYAQEQL